MRLNWQEELLALPGAQRLVTHIVDELGQGRSALVLLPTGENAEPLRRVLRAQLRQTSDFGDVALDRFSAQEMERPVAAFARQAGVQTRPATLVDLFDCDGLPANLGLNGWENLDAPARAFWLRWLGDWASAAQSAAQNRGKQPAALCAILPALLAHGHLPATNVYLGVHWWWSIPSNLELRLLCRARESGHNNASAMWREHLIPALCGCDWSAAEKLWDAVCHDEAAIKSSLRQYAHERRWDAARLRSWDAEKLLRGSPSQSGVVGQPPSAWVELWAQGALHRTPENGLELHCAALEVLGNHEAVRQRLWRAQSALLLPLIDDLRLRLCHHLTRNYGTGWALRWRAPREERELQSLGQSDSACQLGHLLCVLQQEQRGALRGLRSYVEAVYQARDLRNDLAHYKPISFAAFCQFWREAERADGIL